MCSQCEDWIEDDEDDTVDWTRAYIRGEYGNEYGSLYLDQLGDKGSVYVSDFRINDAAQNQGHGRRMLQDVLDRCSEKGLNVDLEVLATNDRALHLYKSMGFVVTGAWAHDYAYKMRWYCKALVSA